MKSPEESQEQETVSRSRSQRFAVFSEKALIASELWTVIVLVTSIWLIAVGTGVWILCSPTERLALVLGNLNTNWKACLLLLVPLFYQTIKGVLLRIRKWPFGMESQEPEEIEHEPTKVPREPKSR